MSNPSNQPICSSSLFLILRDTPWEITESELRRASAAPVRILASKDRRMFLGYVQRGSDSTADREVLPEVRTRLILGDPSEFDESRAETPMANAALVTIDLQNKCVQALTSIIGLPPIFVFEDGVQRILTSDPHWLATILPSGLSFDTEGVLDLCSYGFTVDHRTLFQDIRLVPGGSAVEIADGGSIEVKQSWAFAPATPLPEWGSYTELQINAFLAVLRRMNLSDSFLSLTAGVDTRTILTALIAQGRSIDSYTLSGETPSLDARTAQALCRAYGIHHELVPLDGDFRKNLADYTVEASRLSGGLASLGQAHQVHLYRKLRRTYAGRVSGNMGNQLGRKGVERVSMRGADPTVLNHDLQKKLPQRPKFAWSNEKAGGLAPTSHEFLFQREFPFTLIGNYMVGNFFAVQQSPYASRDLVGLCNRQPVRDDRAESMSRLHLRLKDLHHRFLGESETYSFQRRLIHREGGVAASYPINWGWRAKGGLSIPGAFLGCLTGVDAFAESAGWDSGITGKVLRGLRITGLHEHRKPKNWLRDALCDFAYDTLLSTEAKNSGVLDLTTVSRMLDEHYKKQVSHHGALVLALDLALAAKNFRATLR
jgi:hypothetical protein